MTNLQSYAASLVWAAIAGALMLVTFQPVDVARQPQHFQLSAKTAPADRAHA
jgi:hypothetical protein